MEATTNVGPRSALISNEGVAARAVFARYGHRDYVTRRLLLVADTAGVVLAFALMFNVSSEARPVGYCALALATIPVWLVLFKTYGLYDRDIKRISHATVDDLPWLFHALLVGCLLLWVFYKVLPVKQLVALDIALFATFSTFAIIAMRWIARKLAVGLLGHERVLFIGDGAPTELLARKMQAHPEYGLEPIGIVGSSASTPQWRALAARTARRRWTFDELVQRPHPTGSWSATRASTRPRCSSSAQMQELGSQGRASFPSLRCDGPLGRGRRRRRRDGLGINPPVLPQSSRFIKRALDIVGSARC